MTGRVTSVVVELVSVYRSIAELAGITAVESSVEGTSFASVLRNKEPVYDAGSAPAFGGVALSQMTRCAKATANATLSQGYDPCCKTPGKASLYTFMVLYAKTVVTTPFTYKCDLFTKTGSGQT
jgi:hypothetical protein